MEKSLKAILYFCGSRQPPDGYDSSFLLLNSTDLPNVVLLVMDLCQEEMAAEAMARHPFQYRDVIAIVDMQRLHARLNRIPNSEQKYGLHSNT